MISDVKIIKLLWLSNAKPHTLDRPISLNTFPTVKHKSHRCKVSRSLALSD
jgi:hypothetical protein